MSLSIFLFYTQKTAYEMRISDWFRRVLFRSDGKAEAGEQHLIAHARKSAGGQMQYLVRSGAVDHPRRVQPIFGGKGFAKRSGRCVRIAVQRAGFPHIRSEERRVGKECVRTVRSRL